MNLYYKAMCCVCCNQDCAIQAIGNIYMYTYIVYNVLIGFLVARHCSNCSLLYYARLYLHTCAACVTNSLYSTSHCSALPDIASLSLFPFVVMILLSLKFCRGSIGIDSMEE